METQRTNKAPQLKLLIEPWGLEQPTRLQRTFTRHAPITGGKILLVARLSVRWREVTDLSLSQELPK
jgi:hypothetical protein